MGLFSKKKILVVEDSESLSKAVMFKLKASGFKVMNATSYEEAVEFLEKNKNIRAVWLDHWLHGKKTGLDVLKYIRGEERHKDIPVFVVSSSGDEWSKMYEEVGVTKYFVKSDFLMSTILKEIRSYLDRED